jgi:glycosyltransferase involved in cell wall biosynthesis
VRSLFVIYPGSPLPLETGGSIRYWNLLLALRELGEVDVWLMREPDSARGELLQTELGGGRVHADHPVIPEWSPRSDAAWMFRSRLPRWPEFDVDEVRARFAAWRMPRYDVVLSADVMCFEVLGRHAPGRQVVDLGDVPDRTFARALRFEAHEAGLGVIHPRNAYRLGRGALNLHRYRRLQRDLRHRSIDLLTCSEADRSYLGSGDHVLVVPNGYERQGPPVGRAVPGDVPTILAQGAMRYAPNIDAVRYFARDVLPRIRATRGETRFLVVGAIDDDFRAELATFEGVEVLGFIPRIEDALAQADLVVAPLRLGGGTRIKILEAFSHRIPVVSTSVGAEGLDTVSGRDLLIADTTDEFASACVRLLGPGPLRQRVVDNAFALVNEKFSWPVIRADFERSLRHG